jgi:hypothetical protein
MSRRDQVPSAIEIKGAGEFSPPSKALTGLRSARTLGLRARSAVSSL